MSTLELFKSWTDEEKKQGLKSMPLFRRVELAMDLRVAGWTPSDLRVAGWTPLDLRVAGWTPLDLDKISESFEADIKAKAKKMGAEESAFIIETLNRGLMNGAHYGTLDSCGCFLGTAAKKAGKSVDEYCRLHEIKKDGSSPAEQWFMAVRVGDTPENNFAAERGVKWISEVIAQGTDGPKP